MSKRITLATLLVLTLVTTTVQGQTELVARASGKGPASGQNLVVDLGGGVDMELVWIEPGTFTMGSPSSEERRQDDETQHRVTLTKGFWMGKHEVTQEQWQQVMGSNPSRFKGTKNPVEQVSWDDCQEFLRKLNGKGVEGTFRLPTEAEWEYACRAGTTTVFHYGDDLDASMANFNGNYPYGRGRKGEYREKTVEVGAFKPNAWGLYDMHGNVWEWCQDWYGDYPSRSATDPTGTSSGSRRVQRGGAWFLNAWVCRSANRDGSFPSFRGGLIGFRVVLFRSLFILQRGASLVPTIAAIPGAPADRSPQASASVLSHPPHLCVRLLVPEGQVPYRGHVLAIPLDEDTLFPSPEQLRPRSDSRERLQIQLQREREVAGPPNQCTATWHRLEPGRYFIGYTVKDSPLTKEDFMSSKIVTLGDRPTSINLQFDTAQLGPYVDIVATAPGGGALPPRLFGSERRPSPSPFFVSAVAVNRKLRRWRSVSLHRQPLDDGQMLRVWVVDLKPRGGTSFYPTGASSSFTPDFFKLSVSHSDFGKQVVRWDGRDPGPITVEFAAPAVLSVAIDGYPGHRLEGHIKLSMIPGKPGPAHALHYSLILDSFGKLLYTEPDNKGHAQMKPVTPGPYLLLVHIEGDPRMFAIHKSWPATLDPGPHILTVTLPELYDLTVHLRGSLNGSSVRLTETSDRSWPRRASVSDERVIFHRLRPGSYRLEGPTLKKQIELNADLELTIPGEP